MIERFADTAYLVALFNRADEDHLLATTLTREFRGRLVTTEFVLLELAAYLARPPRRQRFVRFYRELPSQELSLVVPLSSELYHRGAELYVARPDKDWSLTDCTSFLVMQSRGIREALTGDHHFIEAGFTALLAVR